MNDEIKEILDNLYRYKDEEKMKWSPEDILTIEDVWLLLDYITNLQQAVEVKNERIKEEQQEKERYIKFYNELNIWNKELRQENQILKEHLEAYKKDGDETQDRIDKAIEFVETNPLTWKPNMDLTKLIENPNLKDRMFYTPDEWLHQLHIILKGDDENEK